MGGINHQPTSQVSMALTVPAADALTGAMSDLMLGNCDIEQLIQLTGSTNFGVGRQKLIMAKGHFDNMVSKLEIVKSYVNRVIDMIGNPDYQPFSIEAVAVDQLIQDCIKAGLLPNTSEVARAADITNSEGYSGMFFAIKDLTDEAIKKGDRLRVTTAAAIDGPEGTQGYFWQNVESNRNTWRVDFMQVLSIMTDLISFWSTTATICTEVHLAGVGAGSLLDNVVAEAR